MVFTRNCPYPMAHPAMRVCMASNSSSVMGTFRVISRWSTVRPLRKAGSSGETRIAGNPETKVGAFLWEMARKLDCSASTPTRVKVLCSPTPSIGVRFSVT